MLGKVITNQIKHNKVSSWNSTTCTRFAIVRRLLLLGFRATRMEFALGALKRWWRNRLPARLVAHPIEEGV